MKIIKIVGMFVGIIFVIIIGLWAFKLDDNTTFLYQEITEPKLFIHSFDESKNYDSNFYLEFSQEIGFNQRQTDEITKALRRLQDRIKKYSCPTFYNEVK